MEVIFCDEAENERRAMPMRERQAMIAAVEKLEQVGDRLGSPHSSAVKGAGATLRELRPRGGRSPWRAFYRRIGDVMVVGAIGPEAGVDRRGFNRAVDAAVVRLAGFEERYRNA
jgi:hypothetical protein